MIRVSSLHLLALVSALTLGAIAADSQVAGEEALRRSAAIIETRQALEKAQNLARQGDIQRALKAYTDAQAAAKKVTGPGLEKENEAIVAGLSAIRLQLAQAAAARQDFNSATNQLNALLKDDPKNPTAIANKQAYERSAAALKGRTPSPEVINKLPGFLEENAKTGTLVRDGALLYQTGRYAEAKAKLEQAVRDDPGNRAAYYYLELIAQARFAELAYRRELAAKDAIVEVEKAWTPDQKRLNLPVPNPVAHTNLVHTGTGRQRIYQKLNEIKIPEVLFDGLPLGEVVKFLSDEVRKNDPQKRGINFMINSFADAGGAGAVTIDPATGAAIPAPPGEAINLDTVTIKINPALQDMRLADVLDAITKVADKPIKFSVEDYAIVFSQRRPEAVQLFSRSFKVNPNTFIQGLESVSGVSFGSLDTGSGGGQGGGGGGGGNRGGGGGQGGQGQGQDDGTFIIPRVSIAQASQQGGAGGGQGGGQGQQGVGIMAVTRTNAMQSVSEVARDFFVAQGVNLAPPASVFWNDRAGILFVRASLLDLDLVEQAIHALNTAPPMLTIEAKFAEVTQNDTKALGFDWMLGNVSIGGVRAQGGTQPSLNGANSALNPFDIFPGSPQTANIVNGPTLIPAQASTIIPRTASDGLLTSGLRNIVGEGSGGTIPTVATLTGILTDPQFRMVIRALEQRGGVDLLSAPSITTLSGRQTQVAVVDIVTVVSGVNLNQGQGGQNQQQNVNPNAFVGTAIGTTVNFLTQPLPFGPVLDVIPYVQADGYTVEMTIIPTLSEFIGYDSPGQFIPQAQSAAGSSLGTPLTATLPLPRLRSRQLVTSATVWDGQTVALGGLIAENVSKIKDKVPVLGDLPWLGRFFRSEGRTAQKKNLMIFVTPTIIDPAGNRFHNEADLPFNRNNTPAQRSSR